MGLRLWGMAEDPFVPGGTALPPQYLGALQIPDLCGDLFQSSPNNGYGSDELGMAIALNDLRGNRAGLKPSTSQRIPQPGIKVGKIPHSSEIAP